MSDKKEPNSFETSVGTLKVILLVGVILLGVMGMPVILAALIEGGQ